MSDMNGTPLGRGLTAAREASGKTIAAAAERTKHLGVPIHRVALSKMEDGERVPTVTELIVLAIVYDTSPAALMFGTELVDGKIDLLPSVRVPAVDALQWFSGEGPLIEDYYEAEYYERNNLSLRAARELAESRADLKHVAKEFRGDDSDEAAEVYRRAVQKSRITASIAKRQVGLIVGDDGDSGDSDG